MASSRGEVVDDSGSIDALIEDLESAATAVERTRAELADRGSGTVATVAELYDDLDDLLERYEDRATDWDDFEGYAEFRQSMGAMSVPDEAPSEIAEAVEEADDILITGTVAETLSASDFDAARDALAPLEDMAAIRDAYEAARQRYREARSAVAARADTLEDRIDELERLRRLGQADLDAPVDRLQSPIEAYNDEVREAFTAYREATAARRVLDVIDRAADQPLLDYEPPPERLTDYLEDASVGDEPIPSLLEFTSFSRSKLGHYVEDPAAFRTAVATAQTYLERLDAEPLTVDWPPPTAENLRWWVDDAIPIVGMVGPTAVVERLRELRSLPDETEYDRLRSAAVARAELSAEERDRVRAGDLEAELATARDALETCEAALAAHPRPADLPSP